MKTDSIYVVSRYNARNEGEVQSYFIQENHLAIISIEDVYNRKLQWICSTYFKRGKNSGQGIRVDEEEMKQKIKESVIVEVMKKDGKKCFCYINKRDYENGVQTKVLWYPKMEDWL